MSKGKAAKTASKNNPAGRVMAKVVTYGGKEIIPVKVILEGKKYMAAQYKGAGLVFGKDDKPIAWKKING